MENNIVKSIRRDDGINKAGLLVELQNGLFYVCEILTVTSSLEVATMHYNDLVKI